MAKRSIVISGLFIGAVSAVVILFAWKGDGGPTSDVVVSRDQAKSIDESSQAITIEEPADRNDPAIVNPRAALDNSEDLYALVQELSLYANAGDSEALWVISKAIEYCSVYGANPAGFVADTELLIDGVPNELGSAIKSARNRLSNRCRGFAGGGEEMFSRSSMIANKVRAAKAGSLAAEAALVSRRAPLSTDVYYLTNLANRVAQSGDPEAYVAISSSMGVFASGHEDIFGRISGTENATFAWQLAACRRGLDCSPAGMLMSSYCVIGGICGSYVNFEDLLFKALLPADERNRVNEMAYEVISKGGVR